MAGNVLTPITGADVACASADAGPLEVTFDFVALAAAICEALAPKFESIVTAIEDNRPIFDGDALPTPYCTPEGDAIYLCKKTDVLTGEVSYEYQTVPDGGGMAVLYTGPREKCETDTQVFETACFDWCQTGLVCIDKASSAVVSWMFVDTAGAVQTGEGSPETAFTLGACQLVGKETKTVWTFPEEGCPVQTGQIETLCYGLKSVTLNDEGILVPVGDVLAEGEVLLSEHANFDGGCILCAVDAATEYGVDTVGVVEVWSDSQWDCDTDAWDEPTVVTWGDVDIPVTPGWPWTLPSLGCGTLNQKPITITGPASVRAWTYEAEEC